MSEVTRYKVFIMKGDNNMVKYNLGQRVIVLGGCHKGKLGTVVDCTQREPVIYLVSVDNIGPIWVKRVRPVMAQDFHKGDKVIVRMRKFRKMVVTAVGTEHVRVQAEDGRFFDVAPTALYFQTGYKRQEQAKVYDEEEFQPKLVVSTNNNGKLAVCRLGTNPDDYVVVDYSEDTIKEDITKAVNKLFSVWPSKGDTFYFVKLYEGGVKVMEEIYNPDRYTSQSCVKIGNIYRTEEEAYSVATQIKTLLGRE